VRAADQRPHLGLAVAARPDLECAHPRLEPLDQRVGHLVADRHRHRDRHAALAGGPVGRTHQRVDRLVEVGVGHHHHVVLGPA
jgi:hypothetical protein